MNFECKQLNITDDPDFGCSIEFNDTIDDYDVKQTMEELLNPTSRYLLIQRSYPEDEFDNDWYTIESSETDIEINQKDKTYIKLNQNKFEIYYSGVTMIVGLNLSAKEYSKLDKVLVTRFNDKVVMIKE